jgi:hypothetical protein
VKRKKHAGDAVPLDECLAAADELRIEIERPRPQDLPLVVLAQPERYAIACNRTGRRRNEEQPRIDLGGGRQRADADDRRRAGHDSADHRDRFRQRQQEDRAHRKVWMRSDKVDQSLKMGCNRREICERRVHI